MAVTAINVERSVTLIFVTLFLANCGAPKYLGEPANAAVARASNSTSTFQQKSAAPKGQRLTKRPVRRAAFAAAITSQTDPAPLASPAAPHREVTTASIVPLPRINAAAASWQREMGSPGTLAASPTLPASLWCLQPMTSCTGLWAPNPNALLSGEPTGLTFGFVPVD